MDKLRVIIADDHELMRKQVRRLLEPEFDIVDAVEDGQQLVAAAVEHHPDAVIVDISMPVLTGLEAIKQMKEFGLSAKIVVLTIHEDQDYVDESMALGAVAYVTKTRMATDLIAALNEVMRGGQFVSPIP